jgi:hypothetical protein
MITIRLHVNYSNGPGIDSLLGPHDRATVSMTLSTKPPVKDILQDFSRADG